MEGIKLHIDKFEQEKEELQERERTIDQEIKDKTEVFRQKKELLNEIEKCEQTDIAQLEAEVSNAQVELDGLRVQWKEYQKPINDEIASTKNKLKDMRIEYGYKAEKIKEIKKDIKKSMKELKYKQEMMAFMTEEYDKTPKDVNRN
jgi:chromosome segregation ATPase